MRSVVKTLPNYDFGTRYFFLSHIPQTIIVLPYCSLGTSSAWCLAILQTTRWGGTNVIHSRVMELGLNPTYLDTGHDTAASNSLPTWSPSSSLALRSVQQGHGLSNPLKRCRAWADLNRQGTLHVFLYHMCYDRRWGTNVSGIDHRSTNPSGMLCMGLKQGEDPCFQQIQTSVSHNGFWEMSVQ